MSKRGWELAGYASLAEMRAAMVRPIALRQVVQDTPRAAAATTPLPPRIAAGWPARVRACPHRTPLDRPSTCGCREPAACGLDKTDEGRDFVTIDNTCRACVVAGGLDTDVARA